MKNILFLVSGGGGNLKFIAELINDGFLDQCKLKVISDRECPALDYSLKNNIESHLISYTRKDNTALKLLLERMNPDVIITNWHKIIDEEIVRIYNGKLVNLHYSLLPSFSGYIGMKPLELALEKKCKFIGATCHYVNDKVDDGQIISQCCFVSAGDFSEDSEKMFKAGCFALLVGINSVLNIFDNNIDFLMIGDFIVSPAVELPFISEIIWEKVKKL